MATKTTPDPVPENVREYVRVEVIAQLFGVTVRRVQQLTQEGIIKTEQTESGRRYDKDETVKAYIKYLSDKAYGKSKSSKELELKEQKLEAEVALKDSQAELHRMKREIAAGNYIEREEVELDYKKFFVVFKKFAMSMPPRLVGLISDQIRPTEARKAEKELTEEVKRMLAAFVVAGTTPDDIKPKRGRKKNAAEEARKVPD